MVTLYVVEEESGKDRPLLQVMSPLNVIEKIEASRVITADEIERWI